jgi:formate-dependent phosphoribosylglycinamide formyltransferase (GAR transformylase)
MGYRQELCRALERLGISYAIWSSKKLKSERACLYLHVGEFPRSNNKIFAVLSKLHQFGPFTHVIAGTEASVYPAAVARRILKAREATISVALRCHDKLQMKSYLRQHGIPMTDFVAGDDIDNPEEILQRLGVPLVIKERQESGGRGIRLVESGQDLFRYSGRRKIIEKFVSAPEASVESFINKGEIQFESVTLYHKKRHTNLVPGGLQSNVQRSLLALNRDVIKALKIKWGITHMEAYLSDDGILFGEIALRPPGGYIMELIGKAYDFSSWDALVYMELDLPFEFPDSYSSHTAVHIIHPGAGTIDNIENWDEIKKLPSVYRAKLKVKAGDVIGERIGVGEDAGYILFSNRDRKRLLADAEYVTHHLNFVLL